MLWFVNKKTENDENIIIGYSYSKNDSCDGILKYDKNQEELSIEKLSEGADEGVTKMLFSILYGILGNGGLSKDKKMIATG